MPQDGGVQQQDDKDSEKDKPKRPTPAPMGKTFTGRGTEKQK